jgi:tripartite-type tricarboxylate transporter receptor subunit TctC
MRSKEPGMKRLTTSILTTVIALAAHDGFAQSYPAKAIRIAMPFATGGTDLVTRWIALKMAPALGQQIVPEPRTGAGGNIAHEFVARSPADGYTLLMAAPPFVVNPTLYAKTPYDPFRDFTPITLCGSVPSLLLSHPSVPVKTLRELIALARGNPNKLSYASGGIGSTPHLAGELLKSLTKTQIVHVPYKGGNLGLVGAMSGEVDIVIGTMSAASASYVNDGKMRGLAVLDGKRVKTIPQVPTSAEAGLPQLIAINWYVLMAPAGTPRDIIDRLNGEVNKVMLLPDTRERLLAVGGEPATGTPEQAAEFLRTEFTRWSRVIKDAGIKAE